MEESSFTSSLKGLREFLSYGEVTATTVQEMRQDLKEEYEKWEKARRDLVLQADEKGFGELTAEMEKLQQEFTSTNVMSSQILASLSKK